MKINIMTGIASTILWLVWCFINRNRRKHVRKCFLSLTFVNLFLKDEAIFYLVQTTDEKESKQKLL
ncbi:hypothetical protein BLA29_011557 [Euroglyphus maynei]|uniref:Uncharacterized protein n=1 Tax=Euroglyphus maynei TaxID=6958 RepID=A0A1Y3B1T3_EURMA|nr:hypothetical protein BLA29_011557 [Euroglyphus maynei]